MKRTELSEEDEGISQTVRPIAPTIILPNKVTQRDRNFKAAESP
jgi:hypothetical protein